MNDWTTPADLRAQVRKLWERGQLLACLAGDGMVFPRRLILRGPESRELTERFAEVRDWIAQINTAAQHYRVEWRTVRHRVLGANQVPAAIWIDSLDAALALIGRRREADRFAALVALTRQTQPGLIPWLKKRPLRALELAEHWPRLLEVVAWLHSHPRPAVYLRQVDIPGVHSKFMETHRGVLGELFDLVLPPDAIDATASGITGFCRRYGFRDKPMRVRLRILDPEITLVPAASEQDLTLTWESFARLDPPVTRVFITENEINFLTLPQVAKSLVIFGAGYGFENLAAADWLRRRAIFYWGDIDTHGFAILNQLRLAFPEAASLLMDRRTLLAHRMYWGAEGQAESRDLPRLTREEAALYDDLRRNRLGEHVRLEQEKIGFARVEEALANLG